MTEPRRTVRLKTYTAETGLVYQYYYVGKRRAPGEAAAEFVFDVSSTPQMRYSVSVFVPDALLKGWRESHGHDLAEAEIYAAARMRLLRAFDELEDLFHAGRSMQIEPDRFEQLLRDLGVD
jgi:hypothetical protein